MDWYMALICPAYVFFNYRHECLGILFAAAQALCLCGLLAGIGAGLWISNAILLDLIFRALGFLFVPFLVLWGLSALLAFGVILKVESARRTMDRKMEARLAQENHGLGLECAPSTTRDGS